MPSSDDFIGTVDFWALGWAPQNWAICSGQLLPINQNQALFSLIGTYYGGDGTSTFALPDMRGRVPVGWGHGTGLPDYPTLGAANGENSHTLTVNEMPAHSHSIICNDTATGDSLLGTPNNNFFAKSSDCDIYANTQIATMSTAMVKCSGENQAHENRQPFLAINYIMCLYGVYPTRN